MTSPFRYVTSHVSFHLVSKNDALIFINKKVMCVLNFGHLWMQAP